MTFKDTKLTIMLKAYDAEAHMTCHRVKLIAPSTPNTCIPHWTIPMTTKVPTGMVEAFFAALVVASSFTYKAYTAKMVVTTVIMLQMITARRVSQQHPQQLGRDGGRD